MTVKDLSQLHWLKGEIEADQRRLEELEEAAASPKSPKWDGEPRAPGYNDSFGRMVAEIVDLQAIIAAKQQRCIEERARLEVYITSIPDSLDRQIFTLRFVNNLSWMAVASQITQESGKDYTEYAVKKRCYRCLAEQNKKI